MKRLWTSAVASLAIMAASSAMAADIEQPMETAYDWTGIYVGGHFGYGWGSIDYETSLIFPGDIDTDPDGILGGAQAGYNFQHDSLVFGPEISFTWADLDDDVDTGIPGISFGSEIDWYAIFGGRIGFALDRTLIYARGGYAITKVGTNGEADFIPDSFDDDETHDGFAIGGGVEHAVTDNVIVGVEYMYVDIGDKDHDGNTDIGIPYENSDVGGHIHAVTGRVSFKL
jgi:outer membrane immunogenic protein